MIDFENTGHIPQEAYSDQKNVLLVFVGNTQIETYKEYMKKISCVARHYPVHAEMTGSNYLDNRLSLYAGMIIGKYHPASVCIVSDDNDYTLLHNTLRGCGIEFKQLFPKKNDALMFEINDAYLDKVAKDIDIKAQQSGGYISRKAIKATIDQSKINGVHPKMREQIFEKLIKSSRIELVQSGSCKGKYRVVKESKNKKKKKNKETGNQAAQ